MNGGRSGYYLFFSIPTGCLRRAHVKGESSLDSELGNLVTKRTIVEATMET
jgi:hypothetical protein